MSSRREHDPCAMCAKFTRQGHAAQAAHGQGWCLGYERYVHAIDRPSVLFKLAPAGQTDERQAFLEKHREAA